MCLVYFTEHNVFQFEKCLFRTFIHLHSGLFISLLLLLSFFIITITAISIVIVITSIIAKASYIFQIRILCLTNSFQIFSLILPDITLLC